VNRKRDGVIATSPEVVQVSNFAKNNNDDYVFVRWHLWRELETFVGICVQKKTK